MSQGSRIFDDLGRLMWRAVVWLLAPREARAELKGREESHDDASAPDVAPFPAE